MASSSIKLSFFLSAFSAILLSFSLPNFFFIEGLPFIGLICIVPLLLALFLAVSIRQVVYILYLWQVIYVTLTFYWLKNFQEYAIYAFLGVLLVHIIYFAMPLILIKCIMNSFCNSYRPLLISIVWIGYEFIRSRGFLAFPWGLLSQGIHHLVPVTQIARLGGEWFVSFLAIYTSAVLFEALIHYLRNVGSIQRMLNLNSLSTINFKSLLGRGRKNAALHFHVLFLLSLYLLSFAYGMDSLQKEGKQKVESTVTTLSVQQNFDSWNRKDSVDNLRKLINITQTVLDKTVTKPDILLWSETSLNQLYQPKRFPETQNFYKLNPPEYTFLEFMQKNRIPLLTGIPLLDPEKEHVFYNGATLIAANGQVLDSYAKNQLVPLAEYIPFKHFKPLSDLLSTINLYSSWTPGGSLHTITLPLNSKAHERKSIELGVIICFEDAFSFITRAQALQGADLLVNLTNVSWANSESAQMQQLVTSKYRSIETGLPVIRVTNTGINALINPWGKIVEEIPPFQEDAMLSTVSLQSFPTPYLLIGDSVGLLCLFGLVLTAVLCFMHYRSFMQKREKIRSALTFYNKIA